MFAHCLWPADTAFARTLCLVYTLNLGPAVYTEPPATMITTKRNTLSLLLLIIAAGIFGLVIMGWLTPHLVAAPIVLVLCACSWLARLDAKPTRQPPAAMGVPFAAILSACFRFAQNSVMVAAETVRLIWRIVGRITPALSSSVNMGLPFLGLGKKKPDAKEVLKEETRNMKLEEREVKRKRHRLQQEVQRINAAIQKAAQEGKTRWKNELEKDLVRKQSDMEKWVMMESRIAGVATQMKLYHMQAKVVESVAQGSRALARARPDVSL